MEIRQEYKKIADQVYSELSKLDTKDKDLNINLEAIVGGKISNLIKNNWTRKEAHSLLKDLINRNLTNDIENYLWNVETAIIGYCDANSVIRFNDDPKGLDDDKLRKYVLEESWKE